jgi:mono/diheme cytochrome c family protein
MHDQPKVKPLGESDVFSDHRSAGPLVEGTVARGHLDDDELLATGKVNGQDATEFPWPVTPDVMARGRDRYDIFCSPCHDRTGSGDGMRQAAVGHFFDVITNGFGAMPDYRALVPAPDRWAIAAYIRALQASQHATLDAVPAAEREKLAPGTGR